VELAAIGPYEVLGRLGQGGGGIVYRVRHAATGRPAALKMVPVPSARRFGALRREIRALQRLRHPGIVRVYEAGTHEGLPWLAMELVEGPTLQQWARRLWSLAAAGAERPVASWPLLRTLLGPALGLCRTLGFLHGEGLLHGDLKPANVIVAAGGRPVLVDFGLALRYAESPGREALDPARAMEGSAATLAPERIRGEAADARADLYALGCIVYELLSGRAPFEGADVRDVLEGHLMQPPVPVSRWVEGVQPELEAMVLALLQKRPEARPGYADAVASVLERLGVESPALADAPPARAYLYRPGLSGREAALHEMERALESLEAGRGTVMLIEGESGAGKTRLAMELLRRARARRMQALASECLPPAGAGEAAGGMGGEPTGASAAPLQALRPLLHAVADRCREAGISETERLLGSRAAVLAAYEPALEGLPGLETLPEPPALPPHEAQLRLDHALLETFRALGCHRQTVGRPLLLVIDDLQWADELTLQWLEYLGHVAETEPLGFLLAGTCRAEETPEALRRLRQRPAVVQVGLERLGTESVRAMVRDMLALGRTPSPLVEALARHTEGNPFYVAEYLRAAVEEGYLSRDERGLWRLASALEEGTAGEVASRLPLPGSIRGLVLRRLAVLGPAEAAAVGAAAVLGRECDAEVLEAVADCGDEPLLDALAELQRRHVLEPAAGGRLRFTHDKLREAAYERLASGPRRELHRRAAEALSKAPDLHELDAELGRHWEEAGELGEARRRYLLAARRARERHAHHEAEALYRAHLRLAPGPTPESVTARNELGRDVLDLQGRTVEAREEHQRALVEARGLGDRVLEAAALEHLGWASRRLGHLEEARARCTEALELQRELADRQGEARALASLARTAADSGDHEAASTLYEQALDICLETGDRCSEGSVLGALGAVRLRQGRLDEARTLLEQAAGIHRQQGNRLAEGVCLRVLGNLHAYWDRGPEARDCYEQALAIQREIGNRPDEASVLDGLGYLCLTQDRFDEAQVFLGQAITLLREAGSRRDQGVSLSHLAAVLLRAGQIDEARTAYEQSLALQREVGDRYFEAWSLVELGILARQAHGRLDEAARLAADSGPVFDETKDWLGLLWYHCELGHQRLAAGLCAREPLALALQMAERLGLTSQNWLAAGLGRLGRAQEAFEAGQPLFRGELWKDLPLGLRQRLQQRGEGPPA
jgi:eukaryotic-like serine/threonine-protein kinase